MKIALECSRALHYQPDNGAESCFGLGIKVQSRGKQPRSRTSHINTLKSFPRAQSSAGRTMQQCSSVPEGSTRREVGYCFLLRRTPPEWFS